MTGSATQLLLPAAIFALVWLLAGPIVWLGHRLLRLALVALPPSPRATALFALALLPPAVATLAAALGFAPAIGGWIVDPHCHADTGCGAQIPTLDANTIYTAVFGVGLAASAGSLLWSVLARLRANLRIAGALWFLADRNDQRSYEVIRSPEQFAYCVGVVRPKIVLSQGLIDRLTPEQLQIVVRHEQAHAARRDNLRHWLATLALWPLPHDAREPLLRDLNLATEQACDRAAARGGSAALVIEALNALAPATHSSVLSVRAKFDRPSTIASRIAALQAASHGSLAAAGVQAAIAVVYASAAITATLAAHHGAEVVLTWLG